MRHILSVIALALLMQGCAHVSVTRGPSGDETTVSYSGTAQGAAEVMRADVRRYDAETTRDVATGAVEHGLPVSVSSTPNGTQVSTGYTYGSYGSYGYGQVPADVVFTPTGGGYAMVPTGVSGGSLPPLEYQNNLTARMPSVGVSMPTAVCPPDKPEAERTPAEQLACITQSVNWLIDREGSP